MAIFNRNLTERDIELLENEKIIQELLKSGHYEPEQLNGLHKTYLAALLLKYLIESDQIDADEQSRLYVSNYPYVPKKFLNQEKSLYDLMVESFKQTPDVISIFDYESFEKDPANTIKITNEEFGNLIQYFANGLYNVLGINDKKKVGILSNGAYQELPSILGSSGVGASIKPIDFFKGIEGIIEDVVENNYDLLIIDEYFANYHIGEVMRNAIKAQLGRDKNVPIIILNATHSYSGEEYYTFDDIVEEGRKHTFDKFNKHREYIKEHKIYLQPKWYINTSGTTGAHKINQFNDAAIINAIQRLMFSSIDYGVGNTVLKIIPNQLALGLVTEGLASVYTNTTSITVRPDVLGANDPTAAGADSLANVLKNYPNIRMNCGFDINSILNLLIAPMFIRGILDNNAYRIKDINDMSFARMFVTGEKMTYKEIENVINLLGVALTMLYGQNEFLGLIASCRTYTKENVSQLKNVIDSSIKGLNIVDKDLLKAIVESPAYVPTIGTSLVVVDKKDYKKRVKPGVEGMVLQQSKPTELLGYTDPEATKNAFIWMEDENGNLVKHFITHDLGIEDNNGEIHIIDRDSRTIQVESFKIALADLERKALNTGVFNQVAIVPVDIGEDKKRPFLFGTVNVDSPKEPLKQIIGKKKNIFGSYGFPVGFVVLDELPSLSSGKKDLKGLEKIAGVIFDNRLLNSEVDSYGDEHFLAYCTLADLKRKVEANEKCDKDGSQVKRLGPHPATRQSVSSEKK